MLVWSGTSPRQLLGFFPARIEKRRYGFNLPLLVGLTHPYGPFGVPLVEREAAEQVVAAWLAHLAGDPALPAFVLLPLISADGPFAAAIEPILRRTQMPFADFERHERASLAPGERRACYVDRALGRRRQKELRRQRRRLGEIGAVLFTTATETAAVAAALEDFFRLEASGWKGRAGTASAQHERLHRFVRSAVGGLAAEGKAAIHRLLLDGKAIAAAVVLRSGRSAWFWKIAYNERFARYSPGVMLSVVLTDELAEDRGLIGTDSCATADHPMINRIWCERLTLCNRLVALRPQAPFALARHGERLRSAAIAGVKSVRNSLRSGVRER
jgi:hypothetical protein